MIINGKDHEIEPGANLTGADLTGADLTGANLISALCVPTIVAARLSVVPDECGGGIHHYITRLEAENHS